MLGGLHTWTRALRSHPPLHSRVPGGALSAASPGLPSRPDLLVHVKPLAVLGRATCRDHLHKRLWARAAMRPEGRKTGSCTARLSAVAGTPSALVFPTGFRAAMSHNRRRTLADGHVPFQDKEAATAPRHTWTRPAHELLRRFLPHGLPDRGLTVR